MHGNIIIMGIPGLWKEVKGFMGITQPKSNLVLFQGKYVGVDASIWSNQALHNKNSKREIAINFVLSPPVEILTIISAYLDGLREFYDGFGIILLLIYDGSRNPLKKTTNDARQKGPEEAATLLRDYAAATTVFSETELQSLSVKAVFMREDVHLAMVEWAERNHIRYCCAPIEAEWQLLALEEQSIIDAILTIDSNILVGGAKMVIIDVDRSVKDATKPNCNVVRYSDVCGIVFLYHFNYIGCACHCHNSFVTIPLPQFLCLPTIIFAPNPSPCLNFFASTHFLCHNYFSLS